MTHTKEPWEYRPDADDDWGIIRAPVTEQGQWLGGIICQARDPDRLGESELAAARAAKIDPWEANARRIVSCVNALAGMNPDALAGLIEAAEGMYRVQANSEPHTIAELMEATEELGTALARLRGEA